jgi:L,D-transpeptidase catalytic domain
VRRIAVLVAVAMAGALTGAVAGAPAASAACAGTKYQRSVETLLAADKRWGAVQVNGCHSEVDRIAFTKFQKFNDVRPADGMANLLTLRVAQRLASTHYGSCYPNGLRVCLDLTAQTVWIQNGATKIGGPYPARTGVRWSHPDPNKRGGPTPTGWFRIYEKKPSTTSSIFKVKMPWWQEFTPGIGFHQATSWMYDPNVPGSHGCVNLPPSAAYQFYNLTKINTVVYSFGRKSGTAAQSAASANTAGP